MLIGYYDIIYLFHFLFIGPLLIYIGYYKEDTPMQIYNLLFMFGLVVILYHLYTFSQSLYFKLKLKMPLEGIITYYDIIYISHFLLIGPLFLYIGYKKEKTPINISNLLLGLGIFIILHHMYKFGSSMYQKSQIKVI